MLLALFGECLGKEVLDVPEHYMLEVVYFSLDLFLEQRNNEFELFELHFNRIQMLSHTPIRPSRLFL
jgi:hypothetical protein